MSAKALPIVFMNLGGEMLYVLDQRLNAQQIQNEKAKKIMGDIIVNMFSESFLEEIFRAQDLCSRKALRIIFEKLAHSSIMRLNESSMDKLFDLMTMALKYQVCLSTKPREILLITLNHFDSIRRFASESPKALALMENAYDKLMRSYGNMSDGEFQLIKQTILFYFQDMRIKVSLFLKDKVQNWNGTFVLPNGGIVPPGTPLPGTISYYDETDDKSVSRVTKFNPGPTYKPAEREGSVDESGDRACKLGLNMYAQARPSETTVQAVQNNAMANIQSDIEMNVPDPKSNAQLDLLCKLIGSNSKTKSADFKLNLFNNEEEEFIYTTQIKSAVAADPEANVIAIDQSKRGRDARLNKVLQDFDDDDDDYRNDRKSKQKGHKPKKPQDDDDDEDLCAMMDRFNR